MIDAQTEAQKVVIDSQAQATNRAQEGYTYAQERGFDIAEKVASNEAVGQMTNLGVGLGTMAGVGGVDGTAVGDARNNTVPVAPKAAEGGFCDNCGAKLVHGAAFCDGCGTAVVKASDSCANSAPGAEQKDKNIRRIKDYVRKSYT